MIHESDAIDTKRRNKKVMAHTEINGMKIAQVLLN